MNTSCVFKISLLRPALTANAYALPTSSEAPVTTEITRIQGLVLETVSITFSWSSLYKNQEHRVAFYVSSSAATPQKALQKVFLLTLTLHPSCYNRLYQYSVFLLVLIKDLLRANRNCLFVKAHFSTILSQNSGSLFSPFTNTETSIWL